jgi:hypothetical protein
MPFMPVSKGTFNTQVVVKLDSLFDDHDNEPFTLAEGEFDLRFPLTFTVSERNLIVTPREMFAASSTKFREAVTRFAIIRGWTLVA